MGVAGAGGPGGLRAIRRRVQPHKNLLSPRSDDVLLAAAPVDPELARGGSLASVGSLRGGGTSDVPGRAESIVLASGLVAASALSGSAGIQSHRDRAVPVGRARHVVLPSPTRLARQC